MGGRRKGLGRLNKVPTCSFNSIQIGAMNYTGIKTPSGRGKFRVGSALLKVGDYKFPFIILWASYQLHEETTRFRNNKVFMTPVKTLLNPELYLCNKQTSNIIDEFIDFF